jgi:peptidoglycan-associated lipoprotein
MFVVEDPPFYPVGTVNLPPPGPDFLRAAEARGDVFTAPVKKKKKKQKDAATAPEEIEFPAPVSNNNLNELYRSALYDPGFLLDVLVKGRHLEKDVYFNLGHLLGADAESGVGFGPQPADVLVLCKVPDYDDIKACKYLSGPSSNAFYQVLDELTKPEEWRKWFVTSLCRHVRLDPSTSGVAASWIKNCNPLLQQELWIVKPKYILCLGSEAGKAILAKQAQFLSQNNIKVTVEGHCDERGTREYNLALGEKRAQSVKNFLVSQGVAADRINTISYGKEFPEFLGSNDAAWSKNRRAVTVVNN